MVDVRAVLTAHHNHLILQFSLNHFRLSLDFNTLCVVIDNRPLVGFY